MKKQVWRNIWNRFKSVKRGSKRNFKITILYLHLVHPDVFIVEPEKQQSSRGVL